VSIALLFWGALRAPLLSLFLFFLYSTFIDVQQNERPTRWEHCTDNTKWQVSIITQCGDVSGTVFLSLLTVYPYSRDA
jgi:hypothetical protein